MNGSLPLKIKTWCISLTDVFLQWAYWGKGEQRLLSLVLLREALSKTNTLPPSMATLWAIAVGTLP
jgi:hypothetical protein